MRAFVLSGGGAKGSFQAGVLLQLFEQGIVPDAFFGTSVGAINALGYAYGGAEKLVNWWLSVKGRGDILYPHGIQWLWNFHRILGITNSGIFSTAPLRKILRNAASGIETPIEAVSCFVDVKSGKTSYCSNKTSSTEDFVDAVVSSATIPLIMDANHYTVDGGVREQTPLQEALDRGATDVYVVLCNPLHEDPDPWKPKAKVFKWFEVLERCVDDIMCHELFINDLKALLKNKPPGVTFHVYAPDRLWMRTVEFDPAKIRDAIAAGKVAKPIQI
jgi:NTE family protein